MSDALVSNNTCNAAGSSNTKGTNVQVAVRCRPVNSEERKLGQPVAINCQTESKTVQVSHGPPGKKTTKSYQFDRVFGMYSTQEEVFTSIVRPIVDEALAGFNCTIFAYGQTGTGKTHTMEGDINSEEHAGIVPRAVKSIIEQLEVSGAEYTIRVSFLELYNEELQDLLSTARDKKLKLCEDVNKGVVCQNLEEITVLGITDIFEILQRGILNRQTAATLCNKNSSRSHSIFTLKIMIKECNVVGEEVVRHGQLNLVDLAGSECVGRSGAKNDRAREAGNINQSLLTLGRVITALVDHHSHIPYRDSKLTRLLQESLGGKAKTCIIATLSPSQLAIDESMSTLEYAHRAKSIKNQPTANQRMTKKVVLKEYCAEIEQLRAQLAITREKNGVYMDPADFYAMETKLAAQESQLMECESALKQRTDEIKSYKLEVSECENRIGDLETSLEGTRNELFEINNTLTETKEVLETTELNLFASEAVIGEQTTTEMKLHSQGEELQDDITSRRQDIEKLLTKIDVLSNKEQQRISDVQIFSSVIKDNKNNLFGKIKTMVSKSNGESAALCEGVNEMLYQGRETCSSLTKSIEEALNTLIGDAVSARDVMVTSCDDLNVHLHKTNKNIENTLQDLKIRLSDWLGVVDHNMIQTLTLLSSQQSQLQVLQTSVESQLVEYSNLHESFALNQEVISKRSMEQTQSLREEVLALTDNYRVDLQVAVNKAQTSVEQKAKHMEETMVAMLREMLSNTVSSFSSTLASNDVMARDLRTIIQGGSQQISSSIISQTEGLKNYSVEMYGKFNGNHKQNQENIRNILSSNDESAQHLLQVSGDVSNQRENLNTTITGLLQTVDTAISCASETVNKTSKTASGIIDDVTTATKTMNSNATEAMESFVSFIDNKGTILSSDLKTHFNELDGHLQYQSEGLNGISESVSSYSNAVISSVTKRSGSTPQKMKFQPLQELFCTREHVLIRQQAIQRKKPNFDMSSFISLSSSSSQSMGHGHEETIDLDGIGMKRVSEISNCSDDSEFSNASMASLSSNVSLSKKRRIGTKKASDNNVMEQENITPNALPSSTSRLGRLNRTNSKSAIQNI